MFSSDQKAKSREIKVIKTVVLGDVGSGKSSLISIYRGAQSDFNSSFSFYNIVKSADFIHQIWDISGNEDLDITRSAIFNSDAILLVLDSSSPSLTQALQKWMDLIYDELRNFAAIYICITKIDIPSIYAIQPEFQELLSKFSDFLITLPFYLSSNPSNPDNEQINNLFLTIERNSQAGIKTKAPTDLKPHIPYLRTPFENSFLIIILLIILFLFILFTII